MALILESDFNQQLDTMVTPVAPLLVAEQRPSVQRHTGSLAVIDSLAADWWALASRAEAHPFLLPEWIGAYLKHFEPDASLDVLTVRRGTTLIGLLILIADRTMMYGVPVRRLRAPVAPNSPDRFDILCEPKDDAIVVTAIWEHLAHRRDWDVLELVDLPWGGPGWRLLQLARQAGFPVGKRVSRRTPYITLHGDGDDLRQLAPATSAHFRANLRRRRTRLEAHGRLQVSRIADADPATLDRFLRLEHAGWKGRDGTSILARERVTAYYQELVRIAAAHGFLAMYALEVGGEPVAMHLGLALFGRYFVPKLASDESQHVFGPGHLLVGEVLGDCAARGYREFDFLGNEAPWKREWTDQVRVHYRAHLFRKSVAGRLAFLARYRLIPFARRAAIRLGLHAPDTRTAPEGGTR